MEWLIELCVSSPERKEQYLFAVRKFNTATLIMRQKRDYSDDEDICTFQQNIDEFFQVWVQMHSDSGCTNYIHMLYSGHIAEYMFRWRNIHRFSQQGWEHNNSLLKVFSFDERSMEGMLVTARKLCWQELPRISSCQLAAACKTYAVDMRCRWLLIQYRRRGTK